VDASELRTALRRRRIVAILRGDDHDCALRSVETLLAAGLPLLEVSLTGRDATGLIRAAIQRFGGDVLIGAGTVLTAAQAEAAAGAGARFVLTPSLGPGVRRSIELGLPTVAGAYTPSEILAAHSGGAAAVKLFPAAAGGVAYLRAIADPFPDIPLVPVGGVDAGAARAYLSAGALAVGAGSPLLRDALAGGSQLELAERARAFRELAEQHG
jgi:2-dehydro-3-deoxyphosphogluconate aldolase/(4S)-4-hydroxy-2-oxoglutarate aldolase